MLAGPALAPRPRLGPRRRVLSLSVQVNVFKRLFPSIEVFTNAPLMAKLRDTKGIMALFAQTALDLSVLIGIYLPTFYVFKAAVFGSTWDAQLWATEGVGKYWTNWNKDVYEGKWINGLRCGYGKMTYANGAVFEGVWEDGSPVGDDSQEITVTSPRASVSTVVLLGSGTAKK